MQVEGWAQAPRRTCRARPSCGSSGGSWLVVEVVGEQVTAERAVVGEHRVQKGRDIEGEARGTDRRSRGTEGRSWHSCEGQ